jgi:histidinol phosphatase-like PHP family hydrolase
MYRHIDLHVHTTHSDGRNNPEAVIKKAIDLGLTNLGITDHFGGLESYAIVSLQALELYVTELTQLKEQYNSQICIWLGLETAELDDLPFDYLNRLDFILFEDIEADPRLNHFVNHVQPKLTIPTGIAHPQIIFLEKTARIVEQNNIFIELNTHYPDRYNGKWASIVWNKLAAKDIKISIASDAHSLKRVGDTTHAVNYVRENNLADRLWLPKQN